MARNMWTEFSDYQDRMYKGSAIVPLRQLVDLEGNHQVDEEFVARYHETWGGSIDPLMHEMMGLLPDDDGLDLQSFPADIQVQVVHGQHRKRVLEMHIRTLLQQEHELAHPDEEVSSQEFLIEAVYAHPRTFWKVKLYGQSLRKNHEVIHAWGDQVEESGTGYDGTGFSLEGGGGEGDVAVAGSRNTRTTHPAPDDPDGLAVQPSTLSYPCIPNPDLTSGPPPSPPPESYSVPIFTFGPGTTPPFTSHATSTPPSLSCPISVHSDNHLGPNTTPPPTPPTLLLSTPIPTFGPDTSPLFPLLSSLPSLPSPLFPPLSSLPSLPSPLFPPLSSLWSSSADLLPSYDLLPLTRTSYSGTAHTFALSLRHSSYLGL
ncbi:uncharacterized protein EI90DRAFT_3125567 [Cantharellus anzutake]|uniref:uncharacterized protein n=1 Tax=Cantharellus anzutake TaxID=1750568 RepID=UPI001905530A|nr:uncharacterized protein EI90DRAFT_3125567 [Cantharellus anzutake]KAF8328812.1 hypothetical protein EI90DRAFT_3125567 [Cantharellus anzutake]